MTTSPKTREKILQAQHWQAGAYQKVVDCARQYALMQTTGSYLENGNRVSVCFSDRERMEKMFLDNMARAARDAFIEDAMVGVALQEAK
jgi:hypothetical protein